MTYQVTAKRWARGWELHIHDVGVTQSTSLAKADRAVRDYLAIVEGGDAQSFDVAITPEVDPQLTADLQAAREKLDTAAMLQRTAAEMSRRVARCLHDQHAMTGADVAVVLGVTPQRASQLLSSGDGSR